jgi:hypothetical protein
LLPLTHEILVNQIFLWRVQAIFLDIGGKMDEQKDEVFCVLVEIRDTLNRIYTCFEDQYLEIQKGKIAEKETILKAMINTDARKKVFPLLFDKKYSSQKEIESTGVMQQSGISKFVKSLLENDIIEQVEENGKTFDRDKYDLLKSLQKQKIIG